MECRWRQGLSQANTRERLALLAAEQNARERAFGEAYQERCDLLGSPLVDSLDLAVRSVTLRWCRYNGHLLAILRVHYRSAGRVRVYRWRLSLSRSAQRD